MSKMDLKTAMQAILAADRSETDLPSPDELLSFREDRLAAEDREKLLERAATSPESARALLEARRFPDVEPLDERQRVTETAASRQWQQFQERLRREGLVRTAAAEPAEETPGRRFSWSFLFSSLRLAQAAAAALLIVSVGLSWALIEQRQAAVDMRPRLNLPIVELMPESDSGERAGSASLRLPEGAAGSLLVLTLGDPRSFPVYEIEIRDPAGAVVWSSTALRRASEGSFTLELPRGFLAGGRHRLALRGIDGDRREPLAVYSLVIAE